ncbi:MAG: amidohydrolase family protein [Clostridia bacterium]|nr:amidohydrolase family protein [Clostridia bacterium]
MIKAILNANIVLENGILWDGAILIEDGIIVDVKSVREFQIPDGAEIIDAKGAYVGPGFVDIHVHGADGKTTYSDVQDVVAVADFFLKHGTTSMLSTPPYELAFDEFVEAIRVGRAAKKKAKTIKGLYLEGPYINVKYGAFAHMNPWRGSIDPEQFKVLVDEAGEDALVWTIAPEREGILSFAEYAKAVKPDVVLSVGHSEATPQQIRALGKFRPTLQTHSMCATGRLDVPGGTRGYGPDEYCFKEPDVYCEMISDSCGIHVNAEMQQLLIHNKGINRVVLITDSSGDKSYPNPEGLEHVTDLGFDDRGGIAGSKLTMDKVCRNIMTHTNCGIAQAFVMASLNPAKVIGMGDEIGSIEKGKIADLVFVDDKFNVLNVMVGGERIGCENE